MLVWSELALVATPVLAPQGWDGSLFQPRDYRSSSGAYVLEVSPSDPQGTGPMHCRLVHGTNEVWSADLPWTFEEAGVAEDGTVIGYLNDDRLRICVLDAKGKTRKLHEAAHTVFLVDAYALPIASGRVLVHSGADRVLVRVAPADQNRDPAWWTFRISTGERLADVTPTLPVQVSTHERLSEWDARAIGDTGLTLLHWWYTDSGRDDWSWDQHGGVFDLVDLSGNPVWTLPLLRDYTDRTSWKANEELANSMYWRECILATGPGNTFALWHVHDRQRVEYSVGKDPEKGWRVVERSRQPIEPTRPPAFEKLELAESSRVSLPVAPEKLAHLRFPQIDCFGRILVRDDVTQALHVFDSNGVQLFVAAFRPEDRTANVWDSVRCIADGRIAVLLAKRITVFDEHGQREKDLPIVENRRHYAWTAIDALDPASRDWSMIRRRPDGKWLSKIVDRAVLSDGRRVILENQEGVDAPTVLHFYTANGGPLATLELPFVDSWSKLAVSTRWIVAGSDGPKRALVRVEDGRVFRFQPNVTESRVWGKSDAWLAGLTSDGRTLLMLQPSTFELLRFTLP
jgi:hypothetical protein